MIISVPVHTAAPPLRPRIGAGGRSTLEPGAISVKGSGDVTGAGWMTAAAVVDGVCVVAAGDESTGFVVGDGDVLAGTEVGDESTGTTLSESSPWETITSAPISAATATPPTTVASSACWRRCRAAIRR